MQQEECEPVKVCCEPRANCKNPCLNSVVKWCIFAVLPLMLLPLILGIIKAILGLCIESIALCGLHLLVESPRSISRHTVFYLNLIFFFVVPCAVLGFCCRRSRRRGGADSSERPLLKRKRTTSHVESDSSEGRYKRKGIRKSP